MTRGRNVLLTTEHDTSDCLWDVHRVAEFLGLSVSWVYRATEAGLLPYRRIGARLRFLPSEIRAWATSNERHSTVRR